MVWEEFRRMSSIPPSTQVPLTSSPLKHEAWKGFFPRGPPACFSLWTDTRGRRICGWLWRLSPPWGASFLQAWERVFTWWWQGATMTELLRMFNIILNWKSWQRSSTWRTVSLSCAPPLIQWRWHCYGAAQPCSTPRAESILGLFL